MRSACFITYFNNFDQSETLALSYQYMKRVIENYGNLFSAEAC